jgi:carbamoyltransferase
MSRYIIGISSHYHDSAACLFIDEKLEFACEEEKFTGIKHDSSFPRNVIDYIFSKYSITTDDVHVVCYHEDPYLKLKRRKSFFRSLYNCLDVKRQLNTVSRNVHYSTHHMSHMMYSFFSSGMNRSMIASIDGVGEMDTVSIGHGIGDIVMQTKTIRYPHSIGLFYSAMTAFLGFRPNEGEYKVMGLAAYGDSSKYYDRVKTLLKRDGDGIRCDMKSFNWNRSSRTMFGSRLEDILGVSCRIPDDPLTKDHMDIAAAVQRVYEEVVFSLIDENIEYGDRGNLCLGGGCAYNGTANGKMKDMTKCDDLWVPLAPSDAGSCIGACINYITNVLDKKPIIPATPFLGPEYDEKEILSVLKCSKLIRFESYNKYQLNDIAASLLNEGKIIGLFRGRIEFGARALGHRSILASPLFSDMKDRINRVIKKREGFRPFAPMVTFTDQHRFFESSDYVPYMNQVVKVKDEFRTLFPAITHVDGTARVQSVTSDNDSYDLLRSFETVSGYPMLLNTSFNVKDKTIVLTPKDALETFLDTEMDVLIIENYLVTKI